MIILFTLRSALPLLGELLTHKQVVLSCLPSYQETMRLINDASSACESPGKVELNSFKKEIEFKNIGFAYEDKQVLKSIDLKVSKGESTAFVGASGEGKTTLLKLLIRFLLPSSGSIRVDGVDLSDVKLRDWRAFLGFVPQEATLLEGTLAENIAVGVESIVESRLIKAIKQSSLQDYVDSLPKGVDTVMKELGVLPSVGQKQRISLARTLYHDPEILLLDEPTSALDSETELYIQDIFKALRGKKTMLIVAHRLSTIKNCDKIFVLDKGRIVESGSDEELMNLKGSYFNFVKMQEVGG